jgi:hypothetical protein
MYHADRDKGKCDLRRKATGFVEWEGKNQPEIELNDASILFVSQDIFIVWHHVQRTPVELSPEARGEVPRA